MPDPMLVVAVVIGVGFAVRAVEKRRGRPIDLVPRRRAEVDGVDVVRVYKAGTK